MIQTKLERVIAECVRSLREAKVDDVEDAIDAVTDDITTGDKSDDLVTGSILDGIRWGHRASVVVELGGGCMLRVRKPGGVAITDEWVADISIEKMAKVLVGVRK